MHHLLSRYFKSTCTIMDMDIDYLHLGGTRGLPFDAHHPTGWISGMHRLHQKSWLESLSNPSYRRSALKPEKGTDYKSASVPS